jgi:hypothetical protein
VAFDQSPGSATTRPTVEGWPILRTFAPIWIATEGNAQSTPELGVRQGYVHEGTIWTDDGVRCEVTPEIILQ